jgi:hypothetical protein
MKHFTSAMAFREHTAHKIRPAKAGRGRHSPHLGPVGPRDGAGHQQSGANALTESPDPTNLPAPVSHNLSRKGVERVSILTAGGRQIVSDVLNSDHQAQRPASATKPS